MASILYHNPQCSKSRQALALLHEKGIQPQIVEYLKTPLSEAELRVLLEKLQIKAQQLIRTNETLYKDLALSTASTEDALISAMSKHPKLIERPVFVYRQKAIIGRPPEKVLELL